MSNKIEHVMYVYLLYQKNKRTWSKRFFDKAELTKLPVKETEKASEHTKMVRAPKIFSQGWTRSTGGRTQSRVQ